MTRPQGRLAEALRRGVRTRQADGPRRQMGVQADLAGSAAAGPTAVQLAIEWAESFGSGPRLKAPAMPTGVETSVPIAGKESIY